jgi:hypothetical protein
MDVDRVESGNADEEQAQNGAGADHPQPSTCDQQCQMF